MASQSVLGQVTREVLEPFALAQDAGGTAWDAELWREVDAHGFGVVGVPEHMGGAGGTFEAAADVVHVAGALALPLALAEGLVGEWVLSRAGLPVRPGPVTLAVEPAGAAGPLLRREGDGWCLARTLTGTPWARHARSVVVVSSDPGGRGAVVARLDPHGLRIRQGRNAAGEERDDIEAGARCLEAIALPAGGPGLDDVRRRVRLLEARRLLAAVGELAQRPPGGGDGAARPARGPGSARQAAGSGVPVASDMALAEAALARAAVLHDDPQAQRLASTVQHVARVARSVMAAAGRQVRAARVHRVARCWLQELLSADTALRAAPENAGR